MPLKYTLVLELDIAAAHGVYGVGGHVAVGVAGVVAVLVEGNAGLAAVGISENSSAVELAREIPYILLGSAGRPVNLYGVGAVAVAGDLHIAAARDLLGVGACEHIALYPYGVNLFGNNHGSLGLLLGLLSGLSLLSGLPGDNCLGLSGGLSRCGSACIVGLFGLLGLLRSLLLVGLLLGVLSVLLGCGGLGLCLSLLGLCLVLGGEAYSLNIVFRDRGVCRYSLGGLCLSYLYCLVSAACEGYCCDCSCDRACDYHTFA